MKKVPILPVVLFTVAALCLACSNDPEKPNVILVNTARGSVVDPNALYNALSTNQIAGAALDVTEPEPLPFDHPLLSLNNLIIAPHIASASQATRGRMAEMAVDNLLAGLQGEQLPNCVNPAVYEEGYN